MEETAAFVYNGEDDEAVPKKTTSVIVASNVTEIRNRAFYNCDSLSCITMSPSVLTIGDWAFSGCSSLRSIALPQSVTVIKEWAFNCCHSLRSVSLPRSLTTIGKGGFLECQKLSSITLPSSLSTIGEIAFRECSSLMFIRLPSSVTSIEKGTFYLCHSLSIIEIQPSVTTIKEAAFYGCRSLTSIKLPSSITTIGHGAFCKCTNLSSIKLPSSLTSLVNTAFYDCHNLVKIEVPSSIRGLVLTQPMHNLVLGREVINSTLGTLYNVINNIDFLVPVSLQLFICLGLGSYKNEQGEESEAEYHAFINCKTKDEKNGRYLLSIAAEQGIDWCDGLCQILETNGAAIEETDVRTGLETFMLAASKSSLETVYRLLHYHPDAIIPNFYLKKKRKKTFVNN